MSKTDSERRLLEAEVTPREVFLNRRRFLTAAATLLAGCSRESAQEAPGPPYPAARNAQLSVSLPDTPRGSFESYNNYIEFSAQSKELPRRRAGQLPLRPWALVVDGLVKQPATFAIDDLLRRMSFEERIYRFRCVEAWAMVVPWTGFPLASLLALAEPDSEAQYVRFESVSKPEIMPGMEVSEYFPWPYTEALTLDEAMHPLTLLATGAYRYPLAPQNGAPIRLVVPWKYGFKSAKALVRITLTAEKPETFWNSLQPMEYGFYANVDPSTPHPRWSQESERLLPNFRRQPTLPYNGYAQEVQNLYRGDEH